MRELNAGKLSQAPIGSTGVRDVAGPDGQKQMAVGRSFQTDFARNFVDGGQCWKQGTLGYV